jgi:hypothetical protein
MPQLRKRMRKKNMPLMLDDSEKTYECHGRDVKIITRDLNSMTGKEDIYKTTIGKYSGHTKSNDNGM